MDWLRQNVAVVLAWTVGGMLLEYPRHSVAGILARIFLIMLCIYAAHIVTHRALPSAWWNPHIYSHHEKKYDLSRYGELVLEAVTDFSMFVALYIVTRSRLVLLVGLWYTTTHIINWSVLGPNPHHVEHHVTGGAVNYGPALLDLLFGTYSGPAAVPDETDQVANILISTAVLHHLFT